MIARREQQESREKEIFLSFIEAGHLPINPESVKNRQPRYPDIECVTTAGSVCRFELAEVQWHDHDGVVKSSAHAKALSTDKAKEKADLLSAGRAEEAAAIQTCVGMQSPLWGALLRMLDQKCKHRYETEGHPTSLLLFYEKESPFQPFEELFDICDALHHTMSRSQFSDV